MAVEFSKPRFQYDYNVTTAKNQFDEFFADDERAISEKRVDEIDIATWNLANLGVQKRRSHDLELIAYIISSFDIIAIQELRAQLAHFDEIMNHLKPSR